MPMPNFLIIGAAKSGTTALYHYLKQHPQIYMSPVKEPHFFAFAGQPASFAGPGTHWWNRGTLADLDAYLELLKGVSDQTAIGEASAHYLGNGLSERAAENIRRHLYHPRLIAVLRHPADRAYSQFTARRGQGIEPLGDFAQALAAEPARIRANWSPAFRYLRNGFYAALLQPYYDRFSREQIRIYLYEDWNTKPLEVLKDIFRFLQVDDTFVPEIARHNVTWLPRCRAIQALLTKPHLLKTWLKPLLPQSLRRGIVSGLQSLNQMKPTPLDPELRRQLTEEYRDDILKLQDLIGRDLSHWLKT